MDIRVDKNFKVGGNSKENYVADYLNKYFRNFAFVESIKVFFRGEKHPTKKIKLQARLKGKDIYVEASGEQHHQALEAASKKLMIQVQKYKSKRYKRA